MPSDTITVHTSVSGVGNTVVVSGNDAKTIVGIAMQQGNVASDTDVRCGTEVIARNYATNFGYVPVNKVCYNTINIDKTGNDNASVVINYVMYDMSLRSTSTAQEIYDDARSNNIFGPNYHEWLFVAGVVLFFLSWLAWSRISFTRE